MTDRDGEDQAFVDAISEWPDINDGPPTLAGFLLARIAEDEAKARAADVKQCDPHWTAHHIWTGEHKVRSDRDARPIAVSADLAGTAQDDERGILDGAAVAEHIARHDPARVLAECEAKRRIVKEYRAFVEPDPDDGIAIYADDTPEDRLWPEFGGGMFSGLRTVLKLLALPYAEHPDYRPEWRP